MEKKYPVGVNDFAKIREEEYLYIDKTAAVYDLANNNYSPLLCRPRGFGKSLLISTLECYFQGRKELFEGLEIELLEKEWKHYPVIRINMSEVKLLKLPK